MLSLFNFFLPSYLAEKCLLIIYLLTLPLCFRLLISRIGAVSFSYFIFPFIYSGFLFDGFFNFCLSIPLFFFLLAYFIKHQEIQSWKHAITLLILLTLLYFSHLLVFLLALGCIGVFIVWNSGSRWIKTKAAKSKEASFKFLCKQLIVLHFMSLPGIILTIGYLQTNWEQGKTSALQMHELWRQFYLFKPVFTLSYTPLLFRMFMVLMVIAMFKKWKNRKQQSFFSEKDGWLIFSLLLVVLIFIIPNELASGGFVSLRLMLFIFLIAFIWLSTQEMPTYVLLGAILLSTGVSCIILRYYRMEMMKNDKIASACFEAACGIKEHTVILPLNYADEMVLNNVLTYIGSERKIIVWDNYEALTTHFPLKWKEEYLPDDRYGNYLSNNRPWVNIDLMEENMGIRIDYVVRVCYKHDMEDPSTLYVNRKLAEDYVLIKKNEWVEVYEKKATSLSKK